MSYTDICVLGAVCATNATRRAISRCGMVSSSSPSSRTLPASARRIRLMHLISVLLPAPLLPSTAAQQPAGRSNDTPLRMSPPPR